MRSLTVLVIGGGVAAGWSCFAQNIFGGFDTRAPAASWGLKIRTLNSCSSVCEHNVLVWLTYGEIQTSFPPMKYIYWEHIESALVLHRLRGVGTILPTKFCLQSFCPQFAHTIIKKRANLACTVLLTNKISEDLGDFCGQNRVGKIKMCGQNQKNMKRAKRLYDGRELGDC